MSTNKNRALKRRLVSALTAFFCIVIWAGVSYPAAASGAAENSRDADQPMSAVPDTFLIENMGQYPESVRFALRQGGSITWVTDDALWISYLDASKEFILVDNIALRFAGRNPSARIEPFDPLPGRFAYLIGNDPGLWRTDVPVWGGLRYRDLYPGVDLVLDSDAAWRLEMQPGVSPDSVRIQVDGARSTGITPAGVVVRTESGQYVLPLLGVQPTDGFLSADGGPGAALKTSALPESLSLLMPDRRQSAEAPPAGPAPLGLEDLLYSTFLGGSNWDRGYGTSVDAAGDIYVAGRTPSPDFPTTPGGYTSTLQVLDAFVVKIDPGTGLVYGTFIGGSAFDSAYGLDLVNGEVYLTGETLSSNFPTTSGAYDRTCGGDGACDSWSDAFVLKLNSDGSQILYSSYFGGSDTEKANSIEVSGGAIYITGLTRSQDMPTSNGAYDRTCGTDGRCNKVGGVPTQDGFLAKVLPQGNGAIDLVYSTYFGGSQRDEGKAVAVAGGDAFVAGQTNSSDFLGPVPLGKYDGVVLRIDPAGAGAADRVYGRLLGGISDDYANDIAALGDNAYVTGETRSTDFPVTSGTYRGGLSDAFVARLNGSGAVTYAIFHGGSDLDFGESITLDDSGAMILTGMTRSTNFPLSADPYDSTHNGGDDIFITRIDQASSRPNFITYSTYFGGSGNDEALDIAIDENGYAYLTGNTESADFPVSGDAFDTTLTGSSDSFATQLQVFQPPAIRIEKSTNTQDADEPPGLYVTVGTTMDWLYAISNNGDTALTNILVVDNQGVTVSCPQSTLDAGASMTCTASGTAVAGQYANLGTVTAQPPGGLDPVSDNDPSHYFGAIPQIDLDKFTNGVDTDSAPGLYLVAGDVVTWTYTITNSGNVPLTGITTIDDQLGPVTCPYNLLEANQSMTCVMTGTVTAGPYANLGSVTASPPVGLTDVSADDPAHYFGAVLGLTLDKRINGINAAVAPGPEILVDESVTWTYIVTNTSNVALTGVLVTDDQGLAVSCPATTLTPGAGMTCTASGSVTPGAYANTGSVAGTPPVGLAGLQAQDTNYHFGALPAITVTKLTSGVNIDSGPTPVILAGSPVTWTYIVSNPGNVPLENISIEDSDPAVSPAYASGDANGNSLLEIGETWVYSATGTAGTGAYGNTVSAGGVYTDDLGNPAAPTAGDAGAYFGASPGISINATTNGADGSDILVGKPLTWAYAVANTGNVALSGIVVTDTQGVTPVYQSGDANGNSLLDVGETWQYTASGSAAPGLYQNTGWAHAAFTDTFGLAAAPQDADGSAYFGAAPGLALDKRINGTDGSTILAGQPVTWTFTVTNTGNITLTGISLNDNVLGAIACPQSSLEPAGKMSCEVTAAAAAGLHQDTASIALVYTDDHGNTFPINLNDSSSYYGAAPALSLAKLTNGIHAVASPGPYIPVGQPVTWTFAITNTGNMALSGIGLSDNMLGAVTCPKTALTAAEAMTCTVNGTSEPGQHSNTATVSMTFADDHGSEALVSASDTNYYFGASPAIDIEKFTNGQDADDAPGPYILVGKPVTWTFVITNTGNVTLTDIFVVDDNGTPTTADDVQVCNFASLGVLSKQTCNYTGTAMTGQYVNLGSVSSTYSLVGTIRGSDASHYFGSAPSLAIETRTNGQEADAVPGPFVPVGADVQWTYTFTNTGNVELTNLVVRDNNGTPLNLGDDVTICSVPSLAIGASAACQSALNPAKLGQYGNIGRVSGLPPGGLAAVNAADPSHYFGYDPTASIDVDMLIEDVDSSVMPGPYLFAAEPFTATYVVINVSPTTLISVTVTDDNGTAGNPADDVTVCEIPLLLSFERETCSYSRPAVEGQQQLAAGATAYLSDSLTQVSDDDVGYYFGATLQFLVEKSVNGFSADLPPGPLILAGDPVTWTYAVTNTSNITLTNVLVDDSDPEVTPDCPSATLVPGAGMVCGASGTAQTGAYANTATVSGETPDSNLAIQENDLAHYFGVAPDIALAVKVDGQDAGMVPGVYLGSGSGFTWTYEVTNTGNYTLTGVTLADSPSSLISCPASVLGPGALLTCTAADTAGTGQQLNDVSVQGVFGAKVVSAEADGYVFGVAGALSVEKRINGAAAGVQPGPTLLAGTPVTYTYIVTSTSNVTLTGVTVTDSTPGLLVSCPSSELTMTLPGMTCTASGTVEAGPQAETAEVSGLPPGSLPEVKADDTAYYFGAEPQIDIEKLTNGQDADAPPGPELFQYQMVTWTYIVTNTGNVPLIGVAVTDDVLGPITCPKSALDPGASMTCTVTGKPVEGQYANLGSVRATYELLGSPATDEDWSHYFGLRYFFIYLPVMVK